MSDDGNEIGILSEEIMQYLDSHPQAADSLEGVLQWWLCREPSEQMRRTVQSALDNLIAQQTIRYAVLPDGTKVYRKND